MSLFNWNEVDKYMPNTTAWTLNESSMGPGQVETMDGKRGHNIFRLSSAPEFNRGNGLPDMFDKMPSPFTYDIRVSGADTIPVRPGEYHEPDEVVPLFHGAHYSSGYNGGNDTMGRTGWHISRHRLVHAGKGDAGCLNTRVFMAKGADFDGHGVPAGILLNGQIQAGADNVYFNSFEINHIDNGHDVLSNGMVFNFNRTRDAKKDNYWDGIRLQSIGTVKCDSAFCANGFWKWAVDTTAGIGETNIAMKSGDKIKLNCRNLKDKDGFGRFAEVVDESYIDYEDDTINIVNDGVEALKVHKTFIETNAVVTKDLYLGGKKVTIKKQAPIADISNDAQIIPTINKMLEAMRVAGVIAR